VTHLLRDLRFAGRTFVKTPGFTLLAIVVLALGIGANSAIFSLVNAILFRPLSGQADSLVGIYSHVRTKPDSYRAFSYPNYVDIREQSGLFDGLLAHTMTSVGVSEGDTTKRTFVAVTSSNYFDTLDVRLAAGRPFTADEERPGASIPVVIANYGMWQARGLDPAFLGSTLTINTQEFTVIGVTPPGFTGTMALAAPDLWLPLGVFDTIVRDRFTTTGTGLADRGHAGLILAGRLKPGIGDEVVRARLEALSAQLAEAHPEHNRDQVLTTHPLARTSTSTSPQTEGAMVPLAGVMLALSGVVLLIACLNIANMLLARGAARRKEVALRLALGAARGRIVRQLLTEGILLAGAGAAAGLALAYWSLRMMTTSMAAVMPLSLTLDPRPDVTVIAATTLFAVGSTIVFGLGPAMKLSRRDLVTDLKGSGGDGEGLRRWFTGRNVLVVGQIALSLTLLTAGGLFADAALRAGQSDPGFRYRDALLASFDAGVAGLDEARGREAYRAMLSSVRSLPGVQAAGLASTVPFGDTRDGRSVEALGGADADQRSSTYRVISRDYFKALGLEMRHGREFTDAETESADAPRVAIIDEALAERLFPGRSPVGESIRFAPPRGDPWAAPTPAMQIVGVAPPLREEVTARAAEAHIYVPFGPHYREEMHLHVKTAEAMDPTVAIGALRDELRASAPGLPLLSLTTMQVFHARNLQVWVLKVGGALFVGLGLLALGLAVVGVYGVKSYIVASRTREIGIRMALGAQARDVVWLMMRDGGALTTAGLVLGLPLAIGVAFTLRAVMAGFTGFDPAVFAGAVALLAVAALAASYVPARRATRVAPLTALRTE
jgi:predicted permease